ncbi:hypothetical protein ACIA5C_38670 [Actinoplanes sp. NPDC051343]|uniref:hypothetical protein n=1 Tax=Actinoplanes sp. NPDC051343 TaxID=3363906 RepID=UPI00378843B5
MRLRVVALSASLLVLSGCGAPGGVAGASASAGVTPSPAAPWLIDVSANPAPSLGNPVSLRPSSGLPWSPLPSATTCGIPWPTDERVLIPLIVTPGAGSLKVQWPSWYGPDYRVAAVDQKLVTGTQPAPTWVNVTAGTGCTVTATLTGLISGNPYVVWLDAPDTPRRLDNSRSLYSGRSAVVRPL